MTRKNSEDPLKFEYRGRIRIWECCFLWRVEKPDSQEKNPHLFVGLRKGFPVQCISNTRQSKLKLRKFNVAVYFKSVYENKNLFTTAVDLHMYDSERNYEVSHHRCKVAI